MFFYNPYDLRVVDKGHVLRKGEFDHIFFVDQKVDLVDLLVERGKQHAFGRNDGQKNGIFLFLLCRNGSFDDDRLAHYPLGDVGPHVGGKEDRAEDAEYQSEDKHRGA